MKRVLAPIYVTLGWLCLLLGFIGVFLPVLPTTPFVLLAAYFFSKGSKRMHAWLLSSKMFGPVIRDWERDGVIRPAAKALSLSMMALLFGYTLLFVQVSVMVKVIVSAIGLSTAAFIVTRPSAPRGVAPPASAKAAPPVVE